MIDLLDFYPATLGGTDDESGTAVMTDPRSGEGPAATDPLHVGRDEDHSTKAGEHIP
jgi:hypothetical protein